MSRRDGLNQERGIALVGAIFVLVILSLLGGYLVSMTGVNRETTLMALQGARAYKAAQAGVQWALHEAMTTPTICGAAASTPATSTLNFTQGGLNGFSAQVTCSWTLHTEGTCANFRIFYITSVGELGSYGDRYYVSRRMRAVISNSIVACP